MKGQYVTLKDVAERAGTTAATVSYVLNGSGKRYISDEMRQRVEQAAGELGYVKSSAASSLKGKKRKIIAVLVPQFANQFFTNLVLGVEEVADRYGYILSICNTFDDPEREREIINRTQSQRVDGYIITPSQEGERTTRPIRKVGVPMVIVDRKLDSTENYFFVSAQNYESTALGVEHLLKKGHRKIIYIGWTANFGGLELREKAYRDLLKRYQVPEEDALVYNGEFTEESGTELTGKALAEHPDATAVFYAYNIQARGGVNEIIRRGLEPGKDISVLVVGAPDWVRTGRNRITCVSLHGRQIGVAGAEMLFDMLNNEENSVKPYTMEIPAELIEGDSVIDLSGRDN